MSSVSTQRIPNRKKRGIAARLPPAKNKRVKRTQYHSSSEDEEDEVKPIKNKVIPRQIQAELEDSDVEDGANGVQLPNLQQNEEDADEYDLSPDDEDEDDEDGPQEEANGEATQPKKQRAQKKRNDPTAFADSISKILGSKLTTAKREDPVLSRDPKAAENAKELADSKLEARAKRKIKEEKRATQDRGRVRDVMGLSTTEISTGDLAEHEKVLKKMAQRGVVKLFNAVRAAQVRADETSKETQVEGMVGVDRRQEKVNEMSKKGFLDLLAEGGAK